MRAHVLVQVAGGPGMTLTEVEILMQELGPAHRRSHPDSFRHVGRWEDGQPAERDVDQFAGEREEETISAARSRRGSPKQTRPLDLSRNRSRNRPRRHRRSGNSPRKSCLRPPPSKRPRKLNGRTVPPELVQVEEPAAVEPEPAPLAEAPEEPVQRGTAAPAARASCRRKKPAPSKSRSRSRKKSRTPNRK